MQTEQEPAIQLIPGDASYLKQFVISKMQQYKQMKSEWRGNVYLRRSNVQVRDALRLRYSRGRKTFAKNTIIQTNITRYQQKIEIIKEKKIFMRNKILLFH